MEVLQSLSLFLQKRTASIIDTKDRFDCAMRTLLALKSVDRLSLTSIRRQIAASGKFEGITVTRTEHDEDSFTQMRLQFIQALVDNLMARFPQQTFLEAGA